MHCYSPQDMQDELALPFQAWLAISLFIRPKALSKRSVICLQAALEYVLSSRADGAVCSAEWIVVSGVGSLGCRQVAVRGSMSMNLGGSNGSRTTQVLSEHILLFSVEFLFYGEKKEKEEKKKKKKKGRNRFQAVCVAAGSHSTQAPGTLLCSKKLI
jgi:hypothetical protein